MADLDPVYCTDKELCKRMQVGINAGAKALREMRKHPRFPDKPIGGKTFWPAFAAFLLIWNDPVQRLRGGANVDAVLTQRGPSEVRIRKKMNERGLDEEALMTDVELQQFIARENVRLEGGGRPRYRLEDALIFMAHTKIFGSDPPDRK